MGKQARLKSARKNQRGTMPGAWALDSKNHFSPRNIRRIYALTRAKPLTSAGRAVEISTR